MNPNEYLEPIKIRYGSIHAVNLNKKFFDMLYRNPFIAPYVLSKPSRFCLIMSITKSNMANCWVIPIKTKTDNNQYPYEIYKDICIKSGWESSLCISQMTLAPIECIDTREICCLNKETMDDVIGLVNEMIGQRPPVHLGTGAEKYAKNLEPSVFKVQRTYENPDEVVYETRTTGEIVPKTPVKDTRIREYLIQKYQRTSDKRARKYVYKLKIELFKEYKKEFSIEEIVDVLRSLNHDPKLGKSGEWYVSGIIKKSEDDPSTKEDVVTVEDINFFKNMPPSKFKEIQMDLFILTDDEVIKKHQLSKSQLAVIKKNSKKGVQL